MKSWYRNMTGVFLSGALMMSGHAVASDDGMYEVTVTNITQGTIFTPIMVATHQRGLKLFELGATASDELAQLAEGGNTAPLSGLLENQGAHDVVTGDGVLLPGHSMTLMVNVDDDHRYLSVASMLVPTNDAFFAVNGMRGPGKHKSKIFMVPAYDAGTEINDELCVSIPGPPFICAGEGYNPNSGEGYVYIHPGIQGNGNLEPASLAWNNPVAKVTVKFIK